MSTTLARTGYVLPVGTEQCDVTVVNANMTKVDSQIGSLFCTSSTRPSSPYAGQTVFETDTQLFAFWTGSAWIQFIGPTNASVVHECEYVQTVAQSIPNAADTPLNFDQANTTTPDVTRATATGGSIANGKFTLNRAGLWAVDAGFRMQTASTFSAGIWIGLDNSGAFRLAGSMQNSGGAANIETSCSFTRRFGVATALNVYAWHNSGSAKNTDPFAQCTHFRAAWLRP